MSELILPHRTFLLYNSNILRNQAEKLCFLQLRQFGYVNERNAGRKAKELPVDPVVIDSLRAAGYTLEQIADMYDMSRSTLYRILKKESE